VAGSIRRCRHNQVVHIERQFPERRRNARSVQGKEEKNIFNSFEKDMSIAVLCERENRGFLLDITIIIVITFFLHRDGGFSKKNSFCFCIKEKIDNEYV